jgi:signal transduction histidine kinase
MLRTLRVRLTLLYLGFSLVFVLIIGAGLYFFLARYFQTTTDRALQFRLVQRLDFLGLPIPGDLAEVRFVWLGEDEERSRPYLPFTPLPAILPPGERTPGPGEQENEPPETDEEEIEDQWPTPAPTLTGREGYGPTGFRGESGDVLQDYDGELSSIFFMQLDPEGNLIAGDDSSPAPIEPVLDSATSLSPGSFRFLTTQDASGEKYRLLTFALPQGAPAGYFQFGRPIADQNRLMREYLMGLLIIGGISLMLMAWGSWVVAGRSIQPVQVALEKQQGFVANASHELRTPLTLIRGTAELAVKGTRDKEVKTALGEIIQDTDYMSGMVEDLLLLSRIDSSALQFNLEPVDLFDVLVEMEGKAGSLCDKRNIQLINKGDHLIVLADPQRLRQVLWILVDNAMEYTGENGEILLETLAKDDQAKLSVCDSGRGIPDEHLPHVFERFYRADDRGSREGAGLGLSLARSLVEGMGGRIDLRSKERKGTRVIITLERA